MATVPWAIGRALILKRAAARPHPARRSLWACALILLGYATARCTAGAIPATTCFALASALLAAAAAAQGRAAKTLLCAALLTLSTGWYTARVIERSAASPAWAVDDEAGDTPSARPLLTGIRGVVIDVPQQLTAARGALARFSRSSPATGFTLALSAVETADAAGLTPASGAVRVRIEAEPVSMPPWLRCGSAVRIEGRLRPIRPALNPGEPDWPALAVQEGRVGDLEVPSPSLVTARDPVGPAEITRSWWHAAIGRLHERCLRAIGGPPPQDAPKSRAEARALLGALLLGERDAALDDVTAAFTRLGLLHLVAISGFNLSIMALGAMVLLRLLGDRAWLEPLAVALLVLLYMLVLPTQAPIVRSGVLVLVILLADVLGRRYDRATLLGWVACVLLAVRPLDAWSLGFQLSFGIVAALLLLGSTVHHRLWGVPLAGLVPQYEPHGAGAWIRAWPRRLWSWLLGALKAQISAGLLAWAISIPIIACHTGQVGVLTPLMSMLVLPLTVVVLWVGYLALLLGVLVPAAAQSTGAVLDAMAGLLVDVVMWLDRVPGASVQLPAISPWWAIAAVAGVVYLVLRATRRDRLAWAIVLALAAWFAGEWWHGTRLAPSVALRLDALAVGDGSCYVVRRGSEAALWDCGSLNTGVGVRLVPQALRALGVPRVRTVVVTHAHIDHFAALPDVVDVLGVERVIVPPQLARAAARDPRSAPGALLAALAARHVRVETRSAGDDLDLAGLSGRVLWPPKDREFRDTNDSSLVAMVDVAGSGRRVLLMGDASREALANLLPETAPAGAALRADVLELPHHGAYIDPAVELVRVVDPGWVVQSTGARRAADRRWDGPMAGRRWLVTARNGAAWVEVGIDGSIRGGSSR